MNEPKHVSIPEAFIVLSLVGLVDVLEVISVFAFPLPVIGQVLFFVNIVLDVIVLASTQFWFMMKGGVGFKKQAAALAGNIIELFPLLDILPIRSFTMFITIIMINRAAGRQAEEGSDDDEVVPDAENEEGFKSETESDEATAPNNA